MWSSSCDVGFSTDILPDGCRDVIVKIVGKDKPSWYISPLFDQTKRIYVEDNSKSIGFRMKPGVSFNENALIGYLSSNNVYPDEVQNILDDFTSLDLSVCEALDCLASDVDSIKRASIRLGVSTRTLQRLIVNKTGRTPGYWFQLARVRKAGKDLMSTSSLSCVAEIHGFSDQSHMTREFQRWFGITPNKIIKFPELIEQLNDTGYG